MTGLAFKNGLYIFMLRQFFNGVPDALEESAYIDGSGTFRTFLTIILPLSIPMMVTVFLFAFCWQWTDDFYTEMFFTSSKIVPMPDIVDIPSSLKTDYAGQNMYYAAIRNTCGTVYHPCRWSSCMPSAVTSWCRASSAPVRPPSNHPPEPPLVGGSFFCKARAGIRGAEIRGDTEIRRGLLKESPNPPELSRTNYYC